MSKTWETKKRILDMLYQGDKTLTDISGELGLTLATVKQHLEELEAIGAVSKVENQHIRKWKYYRMNPNFNTSTMSVVQQQTPIQKYPRYFIGLIVVVTALVVFYAAISLNGQHVVASQQLQAGNGTMLASISDAPLSSNGSLSYAQLSSVNLTVSSIEVHSNTTGKWYTILSTPTQLNLIKLKDISQLVANASLPSGS